MKRANGEEFPRRAKHLRDGHETSVQVRTIAPNPGGLESRRHLPGVKPNARQRSMTPCLQERRARNQRARPTQPTTGDRYASRNGEKRRAKFHRPTNAGRWRLPQTLPNRLNVPVPPSAYREGLSLRPGRAWPGWSSSTTRGISGAGTGAPKSGSPRGRCPCRGTRADGREPPRQIKKNALKIAREPITWHDPRPCAGRAGPVQSGNPTGLARSKAVRRPRGAARDGTIVPCWSLHRETLPKPGGRNNVRAFRETSLGGPGRG